MTHTIYADDHRPETPIMILEDPAPYAYRGGEKTTYRKKGKKSRVKKGGNAPDDGIDQMNMNRFPN
jgi:hypothetical protein